MAAPTSRPPPVTSATRPLRSLISFSSRFEPGLLHELEDALWSDGENGDADTEWRKCVRDRIGNRGRRADRAALAHAAESAGHRGLALDVNDVHDRHFGRRRDHIVDEARAQELAVIVVDELLEKRRTDTLRHATVNLAVNDHRIDHPAAILGDHVFQDSHEAGR